MITTSVQQVAAAIRQQQVVCYPTEGVWGLGCHPQSRSAFERLLSLKQRPEEKGVILLVANYQQIQPYAKLSEALIQRLDKHWAGFVTCLLPKSADCPDYLTGQFDTIAVRMSHYAPLQQLCLQADSAIVSTSANLSGNAPLDNLQQAVNLFGERVDCYWDAPLGGADKPSKIIELTDNDLRIIRE